MSSSLRSISGQVALMRPQRSPREGLERSSKGNVLCKMPAAKCESTVALTDVRWYNLTVSLSWFTPFIWAKQRFV